MITDQAQLKAYKKKFNFFETPILIADKMAELLDGMGRDAICCDPSVGTGALAQALERNCLFVPSVDFCEVQSDFFPFLTKYNKVGEDFAEYNPGPIYDGIIMNPPFKNKLAEKHVDHAWDCLKSGGRLSALVSESAAAYIDREYEGYVFHREVIKKGFAETSITTVLFLIIKPLYFS